MIKDPVTLTPAEWVVVKAIWEREPCTAPEVQTRVEGQTGWSYSTVRTIMDRMTGKGLLLAEKSGKVTQFRSAITPLQARKGELHQALKNAFDDALTPLVQCLLDTRNVSAEELAELESMIRAKRKAAKK